MKKVISALLLLAMVIGCFAGCAPEVKEDAGLNSAKEYLYTMYKDADAKTAVDYTVVGQVRINDVTYPITWTVDKTENVKIEAGENNMVAVKLTPSTEDVNYKLTATLKNAEGQEVSVSFDHFIPKADGLPATLADGTYVIVAGNLTMSSLAADKSYGYPTATEVTVADGKVSGHVAADVLTIKNVDGGFTIQDAQGRYFYLKGTYNSFNVDATAPAEGHVFSILVKDGKYLIQNNLDKKTLAYSTSYSSWGCYPELTDDHTSLVDIIAATAPAETPAPTPDPEPSTPPATTPPATTPPATTPPATTPPAVTTGASVTFDFSSLDKKGVEITADEALALFNGAASGSGLTAVTVTKIYNGNSTGGAHENSAGFLRCGKSDTDGELVLTFDKKVAKVEILCHDWYTKSANYPTNSNQVAINGGTAQLAPYNETGAGETLTFNLDGSSNVVDFDFSNTASGKTGRIFLFKMIVTFAG